MKRKLTPLAISLCMLGLVSAPAFAAASNSNVSDRTQALEQQVAELQKEVAALKPYATTSTVSHKKRHHAKQAVNQSLNQAAADNAIDNSAPISGVSNLPNSGTKYLPVDLDVPGQSFVSSGPYIGIPLEYSGSNLIINNPSIDQDVTLLKVRENIHRRLQGLGIQEEPDHAHVLLSGIVEGQAAYQNNGTGADNSSIDLTSAGIDAYILGPSNWLSSLISLQYDNFTGASEGTFNSNTRSLNSRVFVNQAFVTIGDFMRTPVYGTFGQINVPFGRYSSNMVTPPLTRLLAKVKARAIILGYQPQKDDALYSAGYIFQGDSHVGNASRVNNGGIDLGYHFKQGAYSADFGGGLIANIADSVGMQFVGNSTANFNGFGGTGMTGNEKIAHRVPAYDIHGLAQLGDSVDLLGEFVSATTRFSASDMTMNNHGARPEALDAQAAYTFNAFSRPSSLAAGYGFTKDALAVGLPGQRWSLVFNTSIWRDTLQSLEFRHDILYAAGDSATGSTVPAAASLGGNDNALTAQFDVYF